MFGGASNTVRRRMQRRHSQVCYKVMRDKLLCLVKPTPAGAIQAEQLENFRAMLYLQASWEPLVPAVTTTVIKSSPDVAPRSNYIDVPTGLHIDWSSAVWELCEDDLSFSQDEDPKKNGSRNGELSDQPTVKKHWPSNDTSESLAAEAHQVECTSELPEHMRAKLMKKYRFMRTHVIVPEPVQSSMKRYTFKKQQSAVPVEWQLPVSHASYVTDESTGECKVQ